MGWTETGKIQDDFQVTDLCNWVYQDLPTEMKKGWGEKPELSFAPMKPESQVPDLQVELRGQVRAAATCSGVISIKMTFKATGVSEMTKGKEYKQREVRPKTEPGGIPALRGHAEHGGSKREGEGLVCETERKQLDSITEDLGALGKNGFSEVVRNGASTERFKE